MQNIDQLHAYDCYQNVTDPQATEYQKRYTHVQHGNCESGLAKAGCTRAGPAHTAGHVEMAWTDKSHLFGMRYIASPIAVARRDLSPVTGTVSQARQMALTDCHVVTSIALDTE